jgi:chemotaxis protein methyltransferase CheR
MKDAGEPGRTAANCADFLQWALPRLGYAWPGFRRVRRHICKRIGRRLRELGLEDLEAYRYRLEAVPSEWNVLDGFCRISISRFGRDWPVFECLGGEVLPSLAAAATRRGEKKLKAWSVGCARGEEAYTLIAVWRRMVAASFPGTDLEILATDIDQAQLERACAACFSAGSLSELPEVWRRVMFEPVGEDYCVRVAFRERVRFERQDVREIPPSGDFDLILCRNLVLTYLDRAVRERVLAQLLERLILGGAFVIGARERLPTARPELGPWHPELGIFRRTMSADTQRLGGSTCHV